MSDILYNEIPSLDLSDFTTGNPEKKAFFVAKLGEAFQNFGFVAVKNHGLTDEITQKLYPAIESFFSLPSETKQAYEIAGMNGQRGYVGKNKETAKGFKTPDLKEFYHIGQELEETERLALHYPKNVFPTETPEMMPIGIESYRILENTGKMLLRAIALFLNLDENYFEDKVKHGDSILRAIHYFPIEKPELLPADAVRAAAHGDINLITLLMGASAEGLQVLRRDGAWIAITALPEQIIVNVGDMLDRLTNNKLKSTIHRVVNPPPEKMNTPRYSIPFFMHPRADMNLTCLENCVDTQHPKMYSDMTAGAFLEERLIELGLKKA
ncbi:MAG: isopenicillin N synthase family oxygenase [Verrucomicrobia bacterium]|nr:isopenicillin N synthase family oxygenase [Cytophagales bacterium]